MKLKGLNFGIVVLITLFKISPVSSQNSQVPQIINPGTEILNYCRDSVLIAPEITIQNFNITDSIRGIRVSILNYKNHEDTLVFDKIPNLYYKWKANGSLEITGIGTAAEYEEAVRKVYYKNFSNVPVLDNRIFTISLLDADYLPLTEHFYQYIKNLNITWKEAKIAAETMSYYGLQGYLATITSSVENDFVWTKVDGMGWIGASDEEQDGEWKWVTGPEKGQQFWQGAANGSAVNNMFSSWASGEPNNAGDEQYAHYNQHPEKAPKSWNDLKNDGDGSDSQYYTPQGFVVEFGGLVGDSLVKLSATVEMKINKIAFAESHDFPICKGETQQLNLPASDLYQYTWSPNENISDTTVSNPFVNPDKTTTYKVVGQLEGCIDSLSFTVTVNPVPDFNFWVEENAEGCTPLNVVFENDVVEEVESFWWDFGDGNTSDLKNPSHVYTNEGVLVEKFDVKLITVFKGGCQKTLVLKDTITVYPIPGIDFDFDENSCNTENGTVLYTGSANANDSLYWDLSSFESGEIIQNPGNSTGPLKFKRTSALTAKIGMSIVSEFGCETDTIFKIWKIKPVLKVDLDKTEGCRPLKILFGATHSNSLDTLDYIWDFGDENMGFRWELFNTYTEPNKTFNVSVIANSKLTNCSDTVFLPDAVKTYPAPNASFTSNPSSVLISNPIVQFENKTEGASHFEWNFNDNTYITDQENPLHEFYSMGFYNVQLSAWNEMECLDTTIHQVFIGFDRLYPPNAFSPNANRLEDRIFRIYAEGITNDVYQLQIYNRWGEMIFESQSQLHGWDGTMKNKNFAPAGVYSWVIQYSDILGKTHKQQGTVTLLF